MRVLSSRDICRIIDLIEDFYMYDCRNVLMYLEKWMESSGVSQDTIEKVFLILDGDKCFGEEKKLCGLREILERYCEESRALAIMQELTDILGVSSPYPCDPVFEVLDYEKKIYAITDPVEKIIGRAVRRGDELIVKHVVAYVFPKHVVRYVYSDRMKPSEYEIVFETREGAVIAIGPATLPEILKQLRRRGLAKRSQSLLDVMSAVIQAIIRSGKGELREF
ncbi:MAG: hypothetical protein QXE66_05335 [Desulfurococcaceae archaeon]